MDAETLDGDFYRERARLCQKLAQAATAAKPLSVRLYFLARAYEEKARATESSLLVGQADEKGRQLSSNVLLPIGNLNR